MLLAVLVAVVALMLLTGALVALILGLASGAMFVARLVLPHRGRHRL